jgi:hypothetical protein
MNAAARHFIIFSLLAADVFAAEGPRMRPLFNGNNLDGWKGTGYVVEDGTIVCTPDGKNLVTEQTFASYILEFDFKLPPGGNNGLGIHYPGTGDAAYSGIELQILDNSAAKHRDLKDSQFHGSIYTLAAAKKSGLNPVGEWNHQRVSVLGSNITVDLNGESILRANLDELGASHPTHEGVKRRAGHIAWLGHGDRVAFKNIMVAELPPAANVDGVKAAGFSQIFNGKSLVGWKHDAKGTTEWTAVNGILKHSGRPGIPADLWTEKSYGNFTLVFDWRWGGRGPMKLQPIVQPDGSNKADNAGQPVLVEVEELDSGIYLRGNNKSQVNLWNWTIGSGEIYGYRTDPSMPAEVRAQATPKTKADRPLGEWNRTMITMIDDRVTVSLNGRVVIDNAELPGVPERGPVGLQHHGAAIDFANIWIKQL